MIKCIFEISTGLFVSGSRWDTPAYNPATQVLLILPFFPSRRGHRLNATNDWFRSATASEIAAQDALTDEAITVNDVVNALNDAGIIVRSQVQQEADKKKPGFPPLPPPPSAG